MTEPGRSIHKNTHCRSTNLLSLIKQELKDLRNARWEKAFSTDDTVESHPLDSVHRKATIVIEHLMQASDVGHTMQVSCNASLLDCLFVCVVFFVFFYQKQSDQRSFVPFFMTALAYLPHVERAIFHGMLQSVH